MRRAWPVTRALRNFSIEVTGTRLVGAELLALTEVCKVEAVVVAEAEAETEAEAEAEAVAVAGAEDEDEGVEVSWSLIWPPLPPPTVTVL